MAAIRQTARIVSVRDLAQGEFVAQEGMEPSFARTVRGEVSRANIIGVVVSSDDVKSIVLDDGSGSIRVRSFDKELLCAVGQSVLVIGRPRSFGNEIYLVPEILKVIEEKAWLDVRKAQLRQTNERPPLSLSAVGTAATTAMEQPSAVFVEEPTKVSAGPISSDTILDAVAKLDSGDGASVDAVIAALNIADAEQRITRLIEDGRIYTNRPGRVKVL
jgi:RPA family protein